MWPRGHKYKAKPTIVDGIRFASKAEAKRYGELKLLAEQGEITLLTLQPSYPCAVLTPAGDLEIIGVYKADFSYFDVRRQRRTVEDVKGMRTPGYLWKKKHVEAQYGIRITEIGRRRKKRKRK